MMENGKIKQLAMSKFKNLDTGDIGLVREMPNGDIVQIGLTEE